MIMQSYDTVLDKIMKEKNLSRTEVEAHIEEKLRELHGLISKDGAAHIVANELGVQMHVQNIQQIKLKDVDPSMSMITVDVKIMERYEVRSFQKGTRMGKVAAFLIADETASMRLVVWDEPLIEHLQAAAKGDILRISNAYVRENKIGYKEVHMGSRAKVEINPQGVQIIEVQKVQPAKIKKIQDLKDKEVAQVRGYIVEMFEPRFYAACPECFHKVQPNEEGARCEQHGFVTSIEVPIVNFIIDDGSATMRAACFRHVAQFFLDRAKNVRDVWMGQHILLTGRVNKSEEFKRTEFTVTQAEEPTAQEVLSLVTEL